jgi:phosphoglycerate dehydrogenase-like enzyme
VQVVTRVLVVDPIDERAESRLARVAEVVRPAGADLTALASAAAPEAIIVRTSPVTAELIAASPVLRVIGKHGVGVDNIDVASATAGGVVVVNTPNANAVAVAEFTVVCLLMLLRPVNPGGDALRSGKFVRDRPLVTQLGSNDLVGGELAARCVGVIGFGTIGRRVTSTLRALGSTLLVHDPYVPADLVVAAGASPASLDELLSKSDAVTVHVAATPDTIGLLSARELALMPPHAILVNTSRASLVDEAALVDALRERLICAAAVDVFSDEPPPPDHPLLALDNALCTPHMAGATVEASLRMANEVVDSVLAVLDGEAPGGMVNPEVLSGPRRDG